MSIRKNSYRGGKHRREVVLEPELDERARVLAARLNCSVPELIRRALEEKLKRAKA